MAAKEERVAAHYGDGDLGERILAALKGAGKDLDALTTADLAPVDAFHIRGHEATRELAAKLGPVDGLRAVDVGCGIGGTSRHLAAEHGCRVTGIDLTEEYCRVATMLSERVGLASKTEFRQASALEMPFDDANFDLAWTEHVQMNIADKRSLYAEIARVLKPGGRLLFHDIFQGSGGDPRFPVPWAPDASISFLIEPDAVRELLASVGLRERHWEDTTAVSREWFANTLRQVGAQGPPPVGMHIVLGPDALDKLGNVGRNLQEGRIVVAQAVLERT
jgi:ubiquinone/menaquinone biosynthesis C-methylase UbiE